MLRLFLKEAKLSIKGKTENPLFSYRKLFSKKQKRNAFFGYSDLVDYTWF